MFKVFIERWNHIIMKILFTNLVSFWKMHFAEELELVLKHIEAGDEVFLLKCDGAMPHGCGIDLNKNKLRCLLCKSEFYTALKMLNLEDKVTLIQINLEKYRNTSMSNLKIKTIDELKAIKYEGFDIGSSVASMIISCTRNPNPKFDNQIKEIAMNHLKDVVAFIKFLEDTIRNNNIQKIYVFNGRLPYYRGALRMGQKENIETLVHERGSELNKYVLIKNTYPHDLNYIKSMVEETWDDEPDYQLKEKIARDWYKRYITGSNKAVLNFTKNQDEKVVLNIDKSKVNVAIFISSEDEMETIEEWKNLIYSNQNEAIRKLMEFEKWNDNVFFYLRIHPNLKGVENAQTKYLNNILWERMKVIEAESPISTYMLINEADIILCYGSTVGIETCFMKKPLILAGRAMYEDLEGFIKPSSHEELCDCINNYPMHGYDVNKAYVSSLKYAWYISKYGYNFKYFEQTNYNEIKYLGKKSIWSAKYHFTQKLVNLRKRVIRRIAR